MSSIIQKLSTFAKKHKFFTTILITIVATSSWWAFFMYIPHPLGDRMEYLGKHDFGALFLAADKPYSVYYYGTDIAPDDITQYFTGTTLEYPIENNRNSSPIFLLYNNVSVTVTYHKFLPSDIKPTNKKYLISMTNNNYTILKKLTR